MLDTSKLAYPERAVLKFSNAGPEGDWKQLKADLVGAGFESTFLNYPKGATSGYFCLPETISDETLEKVRGLKLVVDGQELAWDRCEGGSRSQGQNHLMLTPLAQAPRSANSTPSAPTSRAWRSSSRCRSSRPTRVRPTARSGIVVATAGADGAVDVVVAAATSAVVVVDGAVAVAGADVVVVAAAGMGRPSRSRLRRWTRTSSAR